MPYAAPRPCPKPGCTELIRGKQRYCVEHGRIVEQEKPARIRGRRLQERNARLFRGSPLCVRCQEQGVVRPVAEWDHRIPLELGGADDESNIDGLCKEHHDMKTAEERRARGAAT